MHWCFKNCFSYELMITCYLVSKCGHYICGSCHSRQEEQVATRCPVCNTTLLCYIPNIALRNAARALNSTCEYCKSSLIAEDILTHQKRCGGFPVQCNTCPEKIARNQLSLHLCPNETSNCASGARVRRVIMHRHRLARIVNDLSTMLEKLKSSTLLDNRHDGMKDRWHRAHCTLKSNKQGRSF